MQRPVTVAQRIDSIGVHNVRIQVTVGMISEDVSTLLFELRKKCHLSCLWLLVSISISCGFLSMFSLFSLLRVLVLLEFCCLFIVVVQSLLFLCHFIFHIFVSWSLSGLISLPANLLFLISVTLLSQSLWTLQVSSFQVFTSLRIAVWMLERLHTK